MDHANGYVQSEHRGNRTIITFYHPQSNSMPSALLRELARQIRTAGDDTQTRLVILQSAGEKAFCAGASFDELVAIRNAEEGLAFFMGFALVINAIRTIPKFVIGRVQGKCVGGGVGLAAASDYCLATGQAEVKLSELAVGIGPFVVGPAVERKLGTSAFSQLAINATQWRSAAWAKENGLFADIYPDIAELDRAVDTLAGTLENSSPEAMFELKKICWAGTESWDQLLAERAAISGRLILSEHSKAALARFKR